MGDEVDFLHADKRKSFLQDYSIIMVWVARHAQSTQNRNFAISLQYIMENVKDEIGFLPADQRQKFL